jgi:hypothetical protein
VKVTLRRRGQPDEKYELFPFAHIEVAVRDGEGNEAGTVGVHLLPGGDLDIVVWTPHDGSPELTTSDGRASLTD